jgi:hypothetical protein
VDGKSDYQIFKTEGRQLGEPLMKFYSASSIPSGAKARVVFAGVMYGLKPVPFKTSICSDVS